MDRSAPPKEGKFSFPIIHCVRAEPNDHRLLNILKQRTDDVDVKKHALQWMKHTVRQHRTPARGIEARAYHLCVCRLQMTRAWYRVKRRMYFVVSNENPGRLAASVACTFCWV